MFENIPKEIKDLINDEYKLDNIGCSKSKIYIFNDKVLKVEKSSVESNNEYVMLKWLEGKLPVPKVIKFIKENDFNYLLMEKTPGKMAIDKEYLNNPDKTIKLLSDTIKKFWEIDVNNCPVNNTLNNKLLFAKYNINHNLVDVDNFEETTTKRFKSPSDIFSYLVLNKFEDDIVFSHGDFCLPNIFFENDNLTGVIDLGRSGIGNRYNDISLCYRSITHNLNEDYAKKFLELLDLDIDFKKLNYFILLDELF